MRSLILAFFLSSVVLEICATEQSKDVSIVQLIADPKKFDGQLIRVIGFLHLEFEGNAVYLHQEDYERSIFQNGIWIELTESQAKSSVKLNNGYVLVEGQFSASEKGHLDIWPSSLQRISSLNKWPVDRSRRASMKR